MKKINRIIIKKLLDTDADLSYLGKFSDDAGEFAVKHSDEIKEYKYFNAGNVDNIKQAKKNYKRIMDYEKGRWSMIGIRADAKISTGQKGWMLVNTLSSGGIWGIEDDWDVKDYQEIINEQLYELKDVLRKLGFSKMQIEKAKVESEI